ncbi:MAG: phosphatidate cytidylyltransferase [Bacilli bacterium]|nr:phosphatidate cytidylyltransferase [Bacilli bacterium]
MKRNNITITPNEISESTKTSMKTRIISAIIGICILIPSLFIGDWVWLGFATVILAIAVLEVINCAKKSYSIWLYVVTFILALLLTYWPMFRQLLSPDQAPYPPYAFAVFGEQPYISIIILVAGAFALFFMTVINEDFSVRDACFIFTLVVLISLGIQAMLFLRYIPAYAKSLYASSADKYSFHLTVDNTINTSLLVVYTLLGTFVADGGAYFSGVFFGKNKMNERISPKKTWEGFVGGTLASIICSFSLGIALAACDNPMVVGVFDMKHWYLILILSTFIPIFSALGDFVFSSIKRFYGIKDYGHIIPGHGGVLDRCDSLFFSFIVTMIFVFIAYAILSNPEKSWDQVIIWLI